jgi:hypothetical protein
VELSAHLFEEYSEFDQPQSPDCSLILGVVITSLHLCTFVNRNENSIVFVASLGATASSEATSQLIVSIQINVLTKSPLDVTSAAACDHNPRNEGASRRLGLVELD